jgi:hypothetical protein
MLIFEYFFLFCFSTVSGKRYYAFVETLFVIDQQYFPKPSMMSYEDYVRVMVDTTNIVQFTFEEKKVFSMETSCFQVFQSQNDLDVKIEMIVSDIVFLNIVVPSSRQPYEYKDALRAAVTDYDRYVERQRERDESRDQM